jgi:UDP-N-acetyl-alpha-D-muramoyl-L-alanyl-L-glutamate epimerase
MLVNNILLSHFSCMQPIVPVRQYDTFRFTTFSFDSELGTATLGYQVSSQSLGLTHDFQEVLTFGFPLVSYDPELLQRALYGLWITEGVSYWKSYLSPHIEFVHSQDLPTKSQAQFFKTVWLQGLGELFYQYNFDFRELLEFPFLADKQDIQPISSSQSGNLVSIGGGKDSLVTAQLLKKHGIAFDTFEVGTIPALDEMHQRIGKPKLNITRKFSSRFIELQKTDKIPFNGHVPISAIWAWIGVVSLVLSGKQNLILSNEESANYGNVEYLGMDINHQWSKSLKFETMLQDYLDTYVSPDLHYFSLLRSLSEAEIVRLFMDLAWAEYHDIFSSCNKNFLMSNTDTRTKWCGKCDKCCFVALMLTPYLKRVEINTLFTPYLTDGTDIFSDHDNQHIYHELSGLEAIKPFECVGTPEEVNWTLEHIADNHEYADLQIFFNPKFARSQTKFSLSHRAKHHIPTEFLLPEVT